MTQRCRRCQGFMVHGWEPTPLSDYPRWEYDKCVNCGDYVDSTIIKHGSINPLTDKQV